MTERKNEKYIKEHYDRLIAEYLVSRVLNEDILSACDDPAFVQMLSEHVAVERLIQFRSTSMGTDAFIKSVKRSIEHESKAGSEALSDGAKKNSRRPLRLAQFIGVAASLLIACLIFLFPINNSESVGAISRIASAISNHQTLNEGQEIYAGEFSLSSGYAVIDLNNGVTLVLEAPVELLFNSAEHVLLTKGNLVAQVPPQAIGFKVDTPNANIIDLGTEFGVSVDEDGQSQVHVIEGEVKVKASRATEYEHLKEDQARAIDLLQQVATIQSQPQRFMRTLPGKSANAPEYLHWNLDKLAANIAACDGPGIDTVCYAANHRRLASNIDSPVLEEGRFGQAINFDGKSNWLETEFPGIGGNKPRTVAFWVKVPNDFNITEGFGILSWGLSDIRSAWQISINPLDVSGPLGRIRIGTNQGEVIGTTDLRDDQWHHVAIVLFGGPEANLSTHVLIYIDGELENSDSKSIAKVWTELNHPNSQPVIMGKNLAFTDLKTESEEEMRFFRGALDEVYLFNSALDQSQIKSLIIKNKL